MRFIKYNHSSVHLVVCPLNQEQNGSGGNDPDSKSETITIYPSRTSSFGYELITVELNSVYGIALTSL